MYTHIAHVVKVRTSFIPQKAKKMPNVSHPDTNDVIFSV